MISTHKITCLDIHEIFQPLIQFNSEILYHREDMLFTTCVITLPQWNYISPPLFSQVKNHLRVAYFSLPENRFHNSRSLNERPDCIYALTSNRVWRWNEYYTNFVMKLSCNWFHIEIFNRAVHEKAGNREIARIRSREIYYL